MRDLMKITKALAEEKRIRVLLALRMGELCACQITELFGLALGQMGVETVAQRNETGRSPR